MLSFILSGCASSGTLSSSTLSSITNGSIADRNAAAFAPNAQVRETTECIQLHQVRSTRVIDRIGIAYEMPDRKVWLNRPRWGASMLNGYLVMVTHDGRNKLCSGDIVRFMDSSLTGFLGAVGLGSFVSYSSDE